MAAHDMLQLNRRRVIAAAMVTLPVLALGGCATPAGGYTVEEGVRRLLTLSSQRAFSRIIQPGGFYDDQLTRIEVPDLGGGRSGAVLAAILRTNAMRRRIAIELNDVAIGAADRATPVVLDSIRRMSFADALSVLRGGPTAATTLLERETGGALVEALFPSISMALHGEGFEILSAALTAQTGFDYGALTNGVSRQVGAAIFRAIGREEAAIRANPAAARDPVLIALLGGGG